MCIGGFPAFPMFPVSPLDGPSFSRVDFSKPCNCEVCLMIGAVEKLPDVDRLELLNCPCQIHLKMLAEDMLSDVALLENTLVSCSCSKCQESRKLTRGIIDTLKALSCRCAICTEYPGRYIPGQLVKGQHKIQNSQRISETITGTTKSC